MSTSCRPVRVPAYDLMTNCDPEPWEISEPWTNGTLRLCSGWSSFSIGMKDERTRTTNDIPLGKGVKLARSFMSARQLADMRGLATVEFVELLIACCSAAIEVWSWPGWL